MEKKNTEMDERYHYHSTKRKLYELGQINYYKWEFEQFKKRLKLEEEKGIDDTTTKIKNLTVNDDEKSRVKSSDLDPQ